MIFPWNLIIISLRQLFSPERERLMRRGINFMQNEIMGFISYLHNVKKKSSNTELSYKRDLCKLQNYMEERGIHSFAEITSADLHAYVQYLNDNHFACATVSRNIASIKALYQYLLAEGIVAENVAEELKSPRIEKKLPEILTMEEVVCLLNQPSGDSVKEIRDKAMLELLYATGIRVTELITLSIHDLNLQMNFILCRDGSKERLVPFGKEARTALALSGESEGSAAWRSAAGRALCELFRSADEPTGILEVDQILCQEGRHPGGYHTAYAQTFFCGASGGERCGSAQCAGDVGTFRYFNDTDLCEYES